MSKLRIYLYAPRDGAGHDGPTQIGPTLTTPGEIRAKLGEIGVQFERWEVGRALGAEASEGEVLDAYRGPIDRLTEQFGFKSVDVISIAPDHPQKAALRDKFLHEHTHADFEVRFFVDGRGMFYIRAGDHVYAVLCTRGDLISVPANTRHWFDTGGEPSLKAIRLFTVPEGWVASFTGDPIAGRFPTLDALES